MLRRIGFLACVAILVPGCFLDRNALTGDPPSDAGLDGSTGQGDAAPLDGAPDAAPDGGDDAGPDGGTCTPGPELCNGLDDDCDGALDDDGDDEPQLGMPCDDDDADLCAGGAQACEGGAMVCAGDDGDQPDEVELCDGVDNDCDPATLDGSADPAVGVACDDPLDADSCADGVTLCQAAAVVCMDDGDQADELELCDGVDNDCDPATLDGASEASLGDACDDADLDLCTGGALACTGGAMICEGDDGDQPAEVELCDGADNDCNPATADGASESSLGDACDDGDADLCTDGALACTAAAMVCEGDDGDQPGEIERCDGADNDCNPATADGAAEATLGDLCDDGDLDLCAGGERACTGGMMVCEGDDGNQPSEIEVCDGADNDCNPATLDGASEPTLSDACDDGDVDRCADGAIACTAGGLVCAGDDGNQPNEVELCDGADNDCNPLTLDGAAEAWIGQACDDDDGDLCPEGARACAGGVPVCAGDDGDQPGEVEVCDGADNDCNPLTLDGSSDPSLGVACDDADADKCTDGAFACTTGALACEGEDGDQPDEVEVCDGADNDCNPLTLDGAGDPAIGARCDGPDADLCREGMATDCVAAALVCSDTTADSIETCNGQDDDCDGTIDEGTTCTGCTRVASGARSYLFCTTAEQWTSARDACRAVGGPIVGTATGYELATIDDATEQAFVTAQTSSSVDTLWWIGLNDRGTTQEGTFVWVDGTPLGSYDAWQSGQPDGSVIVDQDCVVLDPSTDDAGGDPGGWNDRGCILAFPYICEAGP